MKEDTKFAKITVELSVKVIDIIRKLVDTEIAESNLPETWRDDIAIDIIANLAYSAIKTNSSIIER